MLCCRVAQKYLGLPTCRLEDVGFSPANGVPLVSMILHSTALSQSKTTKTVSVERQKLRAAVKRCHISQKAKEGKEWQRKAKEGKGEQRMAKKSEALHRGK